MDDEDGYVMLSNKFLVGINLMAFCRESKKPMVASIYEDFVPTGKMGLGNKGGVILRFNV